MKTLLFALFTALGFLVLAPNANAQTSSVQSTDIPRLISYQGLLADQSGRPVTDGVHPITIRFYSDANGTTPAVWEDDFNVTTIGGVFSILLGSNKPLPEASSMSTQLWLATAVGPEKTELRPFAQLTASPYAMTVANGAITKEKMGTDYLGSLSINGQKISGKGSDLNLVAGDGLSLTYDPISSAVMLTSSGTASNTGKGANTESSDNYIINQTTVESGANFNISGSGTIGSTLKVVGTSALNGAVTIGTTSGSTPGQLIIDDGHSSSTKTATVTGASEYTDNRIYTLSDVGANADFVMTQGNQSISGTKTFASATITNATINGGTASLSSLSVSGPVTLGTTSGTPGQILLNDAHSGNTKTVNIKGASQYGNNWIYTVPDVGANADFVLTQGNQSIIGTKTFSQAVINSGDATLNSLVVNSNNSCDQYANARINGGFRVNGCETVTGDINANDDLWVGDDMSVGDNFHVYGNSTLSGAVSMGNNLSVAGTSALNGPVTLGTSNGSTAGKLIVNDATTGTSKTATVTGANAYADNRTYTLPDVGANADFVMTQGNQTINGIKSFANKIVFDDTITAPTFVTTHAIVPNADNTISLGDPQHRFHDLYLGPNSLVMSGNSDQTTFSVDPNTGLTITTVTDTSASTTTIASDGTLTTAGVTTENLQPTDGNAVIGSPGPGGGFQTLYLGTESLVMTGNSDQTTFHTDPSGNGLSIVQTSGNDTITTTIDPSGTLTTAAVSTGDLSAGGSVLASNVSADANFIAGGAIESGNSIIVDGSLTPRSIEGDLTTNIWTDAGDILLNPAGNVGVNIPYPTNPAYKLDVNGTFHSSGNATISGDLTVAGIMSVTGSSSFGAISGTPISGSTGSFTTLASSGLATLNSLSVTNAASVGGALNMTGHLINNVTTPSASTDAATKGYVDGLNANQTAALTAETTRATGAETTLTNDLNSEITNRQSAITSEANTRSSADNTLQTNIDNEASARASADNTLTTNLANEVIRATAAEETLTTNLANEVTRATAAEEALSSGSTDEVTRAEAAESALSTDLGNEVTRATTAEGTLTTDLGNEVTRATTAEGTLTTDLGNEVTRATTAEGTLTTDLGNEVTRATAAEGTLTTDLGSEVTRATTAEGTLTTDLATTNTNLANEITRATAAEGTLTTDLGNEVTRATTAEGTLTTDLATTNTNLANEITRATAAEGTLTTDLGNEVTRATTAEGTLTTDLATTNMNLANEITRATAAEGTLTTDLGNEVTRATAAEGTLTTDLATTNTSLANEITRATGAEGTLTTDLGNEVTRATTAEGTLTSAVNANDAAAVHKTGTETIAGDKTFSGNLISGGNLILSTESDAAAADNTVPLSGNTGTVTVTVGASTTDVTANVTAGTTGQVLYIYNSLGNSLKVLLNGSTVADGKLGVFVYLNGGWRGQ